MTSFRRCCIKGDLLSHDCNHSIPSYSTTCHRPLPSSFLLPYLCFVFLALELALSLTSSLISHKHTLYTPSFRRLNLHSSLFIPTLTSLTGRLPLLLQYFFNASSFPHYPLNLSISVQTQVSLSSSMSSFSHLN